MNEPSEAACKLPVRNADTGKALLEGRTYGFTAISKSKQGGNGGAKPSSAPWSSTPTWRQPSAGASICGFLPITKPSTRNVRPWVA